MRVYQCVVLCLLYCTSSLAQSNSEDDGSEAYAEKFRHALQIANISALPGNDLKLKTIGLPDFECDLDAQEPKDINSLSPKYVNVVAAMGDSVTAGFGAGANTVIGMLTEYRGLSWSIGGDKDLTEVSTLPNVLRMFNSDVKGYSTGTGKTNMRLNVAISGAVCRDMLGQAQVLVEELPKFGATDEDWKVITLWIGGNDLCAIKSDSDSPEQMATRYVEDVKLALDYLHAHVPRAFVNVVEMIDVSNLHGVNGILCGIVHEYACKSIKSEELRNVVSETSRLYNVFLRNLIGSGIYYEEEDFTVVLQPFFSETPVPEKENGDADNSYFAPDCFHFSQKGHAIGATYLWNNMFEKLGEKTVAIDWDNMQPLMCPVDDPYFATYYNSLNRGAGQLSANDQGSPHSTNLLAILVGTGVGVFLVAMAATVVVIVMIRRRKQTTGSNEKMQLLSFKR